MTGADRLVEEARRARAEGDPGGAALSLLRALSLDPFHLGARAALAVLVDESEPPHALVDADREPEAALALAAFCAERQGDAEGALAALLTLLRHRPLSPFARWGEHLLSRQGDRCRPEQLVAFLGGRLAEPPGVIVDDAAGRRALEALGPLVTEADRWLRDDPRWSILVAAFLRKTGHADRALERALAVEQAVPGFDAAVATAMAYRARGELAGALAAYERARAHDPLDESAALDVADLLLEHHRFEAAGAAYRAILDEDPEHPGARAAALYVEAVLDPTPERTDRLLSLAADEPENERARRLATDLKARQTPFVGYLPRPRSALLDELSAETPRSGELVSLLPYLEAPSAVLAARLQLQALGHAPRLELGVAEIPARDPRMARRPVAYPLWDYDGVTARAAVWPGRTRASPSSWQSWPPAAGRSRICGSGRGRSPSTSSHGGRPSSGS